MVAPVMPQVVLLILTEVSLFKAQLCNKYLKNRRNHKGTTYNEKRIEMEQVAQQNFKY